MKQNFSKHWKSSIQPRKQRKFLANAPLHIKQKLISSNLSKDLRKRHSRKSFPLRKGDKIKIMRGDFKSKTGKIETIDVKRLKVSIEGIRRAKKDGAKVNVWFNASNLQITELNLEDKKRIKSIDKKDQIQKNKPKSSEAKTPHDTSEKKENK